MELDQSRQRKLDNKLSDLGFITKSKKNQPKGVDDG
jgi:hypothetical protein